MFESKEQIACILRFLSTQPDRPEHETSLFRAAALALMPEELSFEEREMIKNGEKISAIKSVRHRIAGMTLKKAKDIVDAYVNKL